MKHLSNHNLTTQRVKQEPRTPFTTFPVLSSSNCLVICVYTQKTTNTLHAYMHRIILS